MKEKNEFKKIIKALLVILIINLFSQDIIAKNSSLIKTTNFKEIFKKNKIPLYFKSNGIYQSSFEYKNQNYFYLIDGDKNVWFFTDNGKKIDLSSDLFILIPYDQQIMVSKSMSNIFITSEVLEKEKYDKTAIPTLFKINDILKSISNIFKENTDLDKIGNDITILSIFQFDIDELGNVSNVKDLSEIQTPAHNLVVKHLYKINKWKPSEIEGNKVKSTFEIKLFTKYNPSSQTEIMN